MVYRQEDYSPAKDLRATWLRECRTNSAPHIAVATSRIPTPIAPQEKGPLPLFSEHHLPARHASSRQTPRSPRATLPARKQFCRAWNIAKLYIRVYAAHQISMII